MRRNIKGILFAFMALLSLAACSAGEAAVEATPAPSPTPTPEPIFTAVGGRLYYKGVHSVSVRADADADALIEELAYLPELESVTFTGGAVAVGDQARLREAFPETDFFCDTEILGEVYSWRTENIDLAGRTLTETEQRELIERLPCLPNVTTVDLTGSEMSVEELSALSASLEGADVAYTVTVYGKEFSSVVEEIDLSKTRIRDGGEELERSFSYFPRLRKVIICDCGLTDEECDELNRRYEDIRIVWNVHFSIWTLRTDATNFICARTINHATLYSWQCEVFRYCPDLIALDLGHKQVSDLSFLYSMPQLQYLILVENPIRDITPIGSLKELKYLEIFWTKIEDMSPLIECTALLDLNICYIYSKPDPAFEVLMQMPWLERLWYCGNALSEEQVAALQENMPDCEMYLAPHGESTGSTWREHPRYFEMRDVFEMYYMPGGTNGVAADGSQIVISG